jgi:hypothetical protein
MQTAKIVKAIDLGVNVQLLCADDRGLRSVYFKPKPYKSFLKTIQRSGLKLNGLQINFDREAVLVPFLGFKRFNN